MNPMDISLWIGVITLVLAIPLGVASNLLTHRLVSFLEKRKLIKTHRTRQQVLQVYNRIKSFHDGRRDRYPFYLLLASSAVICAVASSTIVILIVLINPDTSILPIILMLAVVFFLFALLFLAGLYETARKLEQFDKYKAEVEKRWGPIDDKELNP